MAASPAKAERPSEVHAPLPAGTVWVGAQLGYHSASSDLDLTGRRDLPGTLEHGGFFGLHAGVSALDFLGLELHVGVVPSSVRGMDGVAVGLPFWADITGQFLEGDVALTASLGAGAALLVGGVLETDADFMWTAAAGLRWRPDRGDLILRVEARGLFGDGVEGPIGPAGVFSIGLDLVAHGPAPPIQKAPPVAEPPPPPPDRDYDGIVDAEDACPDAAGPAAHHGCPDTDSDGVADTTDACPTTAGLPALLGCPDTDGDGLTDAEDACPKQGGSRARRGCPEAPKSVLEQLNRPVADIVFAKGEALVLARSEAAIARIAEMMHRYPHLRLEVQAHTSSRGKRRTLLDLSERRARAVVRGLVDLGLDPTRLVAKGYGPDQPVATNRTRAGRALNERIELRVIEDPSGAESE